LRKDARRLSVAGIFVFVLSFCASFASAQSNSGYLDQLVQKIDQERLFDDIGWKKVLFNGRFDDPEFYRAGKKLGRKSPRAEMIATLKAFLQPGPIVIKGDARHAQCYYPARFDYLKDKLQFDLSQFPKPFCKELEQFRSFASYTGVSLVFSNFFANNPASMFGHTLLRLHRSVKQGEPGLLDDAANFAAHIETINPFTYPVKGLMGFFPGRFALLPYSGKIQEYSNYESRDLWEYELDFSPQETHRLALSLWEAAYFYMDYFYLDENCSYMILALLEAARPSLRLTEAFHLYTIPSDTIKVVSRVPGLVRAIHFKPSARSRYVERAEALTQQERTLFLAILKQFESTFDKQQFEQILTQENCDQACRIRLYDALIEFIDFSEKKVSTKKLTRYQKLRLGVLLARSQITHPSPPFVNKPDKARIDRGARSAALEFNTGWTGAGYNNSEFRWRPAYHDLASSSMGYSEQLQIQVLDFVLAHNSRWDQTYIKRWIPLELTSLGKSELALTPLSWRVEMGYSKDRNRRDQSHLYDRSAVKVGFGAARFWGSFTGFVMAQGSGGYSSDSELFWHLGVGPRVGAYWALSDSVKLSMIWEWTRLYGTNGDLDRRDLISRLAYFWRIENEAYLEFRDQDFEHYGGIGYRFYY